jgi:murein DD-endopeptidase MepM/ murein hydrolase activator NlpD
MRRFVPLVVALGALLPAMSTGGAHADDPIKQAAVEIADARQKANDAADAYFEAESRLDTLNVDAQTLGGDVAALEGKVEALRQRVAQIAVNRFTRSTVSSSPLLSGFNTPEDLMQVAALSAVINDQSQDDLDSFKSLNAQLADKQRALADKQQEAEKEKATAAVLRDLATAGVQHLKEVEASRLQDQAVKNALAAEEASRAAVTAAAHAPKVDQATTTTVLLDGFENDAQQVAPQTSVPKKGSGGLTGFGGAGGRPGGLGGADYGGTDFVCPTGDYPVSFGDTWGAPRSGGRRHEGTDMIGPIGVPIYAVKDGFAEPRTEELGGHTIWLSAVDGNKYYYGHLDHYGKLGNVQAGDLIAYMGQTGNARFSVSHLHFGIYPGGGSAVNPYPTLRIHC